jgi:hypothetical protein
MPNGTVPEGEPHSCQKLRDVVRKSRQTFESIKSDTRALFGARIYGL